MIFSVHLLPEKGLNSIQIKEAHNTQAKGRQELIMFFSVQLP